MQSMALSSVSDISKTMQPFGLWNEMRSYTQEVEHTHIRSNNILKNYIFFVGLLIDYKMVFYESYTNFNAVIVSHQASGNGAYFRILLIPGCINSNAPVSFCTIHTPSSQYSAQVTVVPNMLSLSTTNVSYR